jgi:hypothetical protein
MARAFALNKGVPSRDQAAVGASSLLLPSLDLSRLWVSGRGHFWMEKRIPLFLKML